MSLTVYNTLTRREEALSPLKEGEVSLYVCGPTVYDDPHIGHLRSAFVFDLVRKVLAESYRVRWVRNVTDVDDKIIDRARAEKQGPGEIAQRYLESFHQAVARLGLEPPTVEPMATQHIPDMIQFIETLLGKGTAYLGGGNVYFRVRRFSGYGELSGQKIDQMLEHVRIEPGEGKEDPLDFALWKRVPPEEPSWESPWGKGRPGWHIECSAMSLRWLGKEFDIHGGGRDLVFPHHENERAQSVMATGGSFARVWLHHGLLTFEGQKMSKSLKNFLTLDAVLERTSLDVLKLFFLQSHYRSDIDFTWPKITALEEACRHVTLFFEKLNLPDSREANDVDPSLWKDLDGSFLECLRRDFNSPEALGVLFRALKEGHEDLQSRRSLQAFTRGRWIMERGLWLGLFDAYRSRPSKAAPDWQPLLEELLAYRNRKRREKRYEISDFIRSELIKIGFEAEDQKESSKIWNLCGIPSHEAVADRLTSLLREAQAMERKSGC